MGNENVWLDPRTWTSIASATIGLLGFMFAILSFRWNRAESRLDALSKVLQPLYRAAQHLFTANEARSRCEHLKLSFPKGENDRHKEAELRIKKSYDDYNSAIAESVKEFRLAESEFGARSFRFPDRIARLVDTALKSLSEFGRLVNLGAFAKADLQFAKFRDDYTLISREGRGWRLLDPFEWVKKRFKRRETKTVNSPYELSKEEMNAIMELVHRRATSQAENTFAVHPPEKLIHHPEILKSDDVVSELERSVFHVVFQDGTRRLMTLVELVVFTYNLIFLAQQMIEIDQMMRATNHTGPTEISVNLTMSIGDLMRPEMVRALLGKIEFSNIPSDGAALDKKSQSVPPDGQHG